MSDDLTHVSFELGSDTGTNDAASIEPIGLEPALPEAFNRAPEHLRERTERLRSDLNKVIWLLRRLPWTIYSESTPVEVKWSGPYNGVDPLLGIVSLSDPVILEGLVGPGESRSGVGGLTDDDMGGAVHASTRSTLQWVVGGDTVKLYSIETRDQGASWLSLEVVVGTAVVATPVVVVNGTAPATADLGFQPGLDRIHVTLSSDLSNTTQDVIDAINAHPVAGSLVTANLEAGLGTEIAVALARTAFDRGTAAVRMRLTGATLSAWFASGWPSNNLREGDTLAVYFSSVNNLVARRTENGIDIAIGELANLTREPDKTERSIPIGRVLGGNLHLVNGVVVQTLPGGAASEFLVDAGHARSVRAAVYTGTEISTVEPSLGRQVTEIWQWLDAIAAGTTDLAYLAVNVDAADMPISGLGDRARIEDDATAVQTRWRRRDALLGSGDRLARLLFDEEAALGVRARIDVERDTGDTTAVRFYVHDSAALREVLSLGPTTYFNLREESAAAGAAVSDAALVCDGRSTIATGVSTALALRNKIAGGAPVATTASGVSIAFSGDVPDGVGGNETGLFCGISGRLSIPGAGGSTHTALMDITVTTLPGAPAVVARFGDMLGTGGMPFVAFGSNLGVNGVIGPHLGQVAAGLYGNTTVARGVALEIGNADLSSSGGGRATAITFAGQTDDGLNTEYELACVRVSAPAGVAGADTRGRMRVYVNNGAATFADGSGYYQEFDEDARHWTNNASGKIRQDVAAVAEIDVNATTTDPHKNVNGLTRARGIDSVARTGTTGKYEIEMVAGAVPDANYIVRVSAKTGGLAPDLTFDFNPTSATSFELRTFVGGVAQWTTTASLMVEVWHPGW